MADARHFCPECGSIDLEIASLIEAPVEGGTRKARCVNCSWEGYLSQTIGAVTSEQFWDIERIGEVLIRVITTRAAGPLVSTLEYIGILPPMNRTPLENSDRSENAQRIRHYNELAQKAKDHVMRAITEAAVTAAFNSAVEARATFDKALEVSMGDVTSGVN